MYSSKPLIGICGNVAVPGFDYAEVNVQEYFTPEAPFSPAPGNMPIYAANCFLPGALKCVGPEADLERILRYADSAFARAKALSLSVIVFGSGGSRRIPEGFDRARAMGQFAATLKALAPRAGAAGLTLTVEPLHRGECNFINSLAEGAEAVERCNHESVRLLCDFFHMAREGEGPDAIRRHGKLLRHAHIAEKEIRSCPGVKGDDFGGYFEALRETGYSGNLSFECEFGDLSAEAPRGIAEVRRQLAGAGFDVLK